MKICVDFNEVNSNINTSFIQTKCSFNTNFNELDSFISVNFIQTDCSINTDFGEVFFINTGDVYTGEYDVIPRVYQQVLETKDKLMSNDVTIEIIPLSKVINLSNGYTVIIG